MLIAGSDSTPYCSSHSTELGTFLPAISDSFTHLCNRSREGIQVEEEVNARVCKSLHAFSVISVRINVINSDCVCSQVLHLLRIQLALVCIDKGVVWSQLVCNAYEELVRRYNLNGVR